MQPTLEQEAAPNAQNESYSTPYKWYVVTVLTICYTLSFVDRTILSLLVAPVKRDLGLSDQQIGLLGGLAFALFYTFIGLPMGRWADTHNRRNLIATGLTVWSLFTALCAAAKSYFTLFLARLGVGVGEAALSPAAYSILADLFPKQQLSSAISVFYMGAFLGAALANFVGGYTLQAVAGTPTIVVPILGTIASWRLTFLIVGLPGLLIALLVFTIREPLRKSLAATPTSQFTLAQSIAELRKRWKSVAGISIGMICHGITTYGFLAWAPTYFNRVHGWNPGRTGQALGTVLLVGCLGMYVGGLLSDRWIRRGVYTGPLRVAFPAAIVGLLTFPYAFLQSDPNVTLILSAIGLFFWALAMATPFAAVQMIFPNQARAQVSALVLFALNLGGNSIGPWLPGFLNDVVFHDGKAIGTSLAVMIAGASIAMFIVFGLAMKPYQKDYVEMHGGYEAPTRT
jgi:MFS family permease